MDFFLHADPPAKKVSLCEVVVVDIAYGRSTIPDSGWCFFFERKEERNDMEKEAFNNVTDTETTASSENPSRLLKEELPNVKRVIFSGIEGSFAAIAAHRLFPEGEFSHAHSFKEAYEKVADGICDAAVLPIENSYAGEVGQVSDLMFGGDLQVRFIYELSISQCLLGVPGGSIDQIRTVISHPQALEQSAEFISAHNWETQPYENTARAAREVARKGDPAFAAVGSAETAELYDLTILARDINESAQNTTRFAVFVRKEEEGRKDAAQVILQENENAVESSAEKESSENTILIFTIKHVAGSLAKAVTIIGMYDFNMRVIRSRPVKEKNWQYYFYTELEGRVDTEDGKNMLKLLRTACELIKVVGIYRPLK